MQRSFGLLGPPRTTFERTIFETAYTNTPDAATLTLHVFNLLRNPQNINLRFRISHFLNIHIVQKLSVQTNRTFIVFFLII